jgi:hypothetical protein
MGGRVTSLSMICVPRAHISGIECGSSKAKSIDLRLLTSGILGIHYHRLNAHLC